MTDSFSLTTSNFTFLKFDLPSLYTLDARVKMLVHADATTALTKLRRLGEKLICQLCTEHQLPLHTENTQHQQLDELRRMRLPFQVESVIGLMRRKSKSAAHENQSKGTLNHLLTPR